MSKQSGLQLVRLSFYKLNTNITILYFVIALHFCIAASTYSEAISFRKIAGLGNRRRRTGKEGDFKSKRKTALKEFSP